jgi:LysR family transcriptional regulator, positive regulator for ilvC
MDIQRLRMFVTLADTLHFHHAAALCHASPSTLSRCIQQMEETLHCRLFERDNRTVTITPQGIHLLKFARETIQGWETLQDQMQVDFQHLRGSLSLYCSVTASYSFLYDMLRDFRQQQPLIGITLHTGDPALAIDRILAGQEDIAIAARLDSMPPEVSFKRITRSPLVLIQPLHDEWLGASIKNNFQDWSKVPFILSEKGVARTRMDQWFITNSIAPNIYAQVAGHEAIVSMVSLGFGVGLVPKIVLDNSPLADKVRPTPIQPELEPYDVGLCVSERRLKSPIVRAFWQQVTNQTEE